MEEEHVVYVVDEHVVFVEEKHVVFVVVDPDIIRSRHAARSGDSSPPRSRSLFAR